MHQPSKAHVLRQVPTKKRTIPTSARGPYPNHDRNEVHMEISRSLSQMRRSSIFTTRIYPSDHESWARIMEAREHKGATIFISCMPLTSSLSTCQYSVLRFAGVSTGRNWHQSEELFDKSKIWHHSVQLSSLLCSQYFPVKITTGHLLRTKRMRKEVFRN